MPKPPKAAASEFEDAMVDLETWGRRPGCQLLSIGVQMFNPTAGLLGPQFYLAVRDDGYQTKAGLHKDPDTVAWWARQSTAAKTVLLDCKDKTRSKSIGAALDDLTTFLMAQAGRRKLRVWGNGSDFDCTILLEAYRATGRDGKAPWEFWNHRCFRTLKNLAKHVPEPKDGGTAHNALDDAKKQAEHALAIFKALGLQGWPV